MSVTTTFTVKNNLSIPTTNHVLVFLKPVKASSNFQYIAWQDLNPAIGGSQDFDYVIDLGVQVGDASSGNPPGPQSPVYSINPGELFSATNPNGQGPILSTKNVNQGNLTSAQAGVINNCNSPVTSLSMTWTNKGLPVVNVGVNSNDVINQGKTVSLELEPKIYFMAADPTLVGKNFTLQDFSSMTEFDLVAGTTGVSVEWTRGNNGLGIDEFSFKQS
ncbi:hypothetical protein [Agaribacterium sp. ZY112]|uniref:hypothetical protein n=1 Tax=Agaribacterium sp. ZY112 TaxID=3233574 RepID=UPI0035232D88